MKEKIHYDFLKDNNFSELKDTELMQGRLQIMQLIDPYVGTYFSKAWIKKNVLHLNEEDVEEMDGQIEQEAAEEPEPTAQASSAGQQQQPNDINQAFKAGFTK